MKEKEEISLLNERLDSIERVLKLLVVNSITDNMLDSVFPKKRNDSFSIPKELTDLLGEYHFAYAGIEVKNGVELICLKPLTVAYKYELIHFVTLNADIKTNFSLIPVFVFEKINGNRRKYFIKNKISFITEKEISIHTVLE